MEDFEKGGNVKQEEARKKIKRVLLLVLIGAMPLLMATSRCSLPFLTS